MAVNNTVRAAFRITVSVIVLILLIVLVQSADRMPLVKY